MRCPTCKKEFHPQPDTIKYYLLSQYTACKLVAQRCPSCQEVIVIRQEGNIVLNSYEFDLVHKEEIIYPAPTGKNIETSTEIPLGYKNDFLEAYSALQFSTKASAALSRRLLQKVFREKLGIKKRDLSQEIDEFISIAQAPSYLTDAIDAVRQIGNFAAHPIKYEHSGEIVEVEQGEAEWLLEVLESLFDFAFVQPAKLDRRRQSLNEKLEALGKPRLKGD